MNIAQRIVLVIALGAGLGLFGEWVTTRDSATGWVGYAPLSNATFTSAGALHPWVRLLILLGLTVVWMVSSVALLRTRNAPSGQ